MIALSREARLDRVTLLRRAASAGGPQTNGIVAVEVHEGGSSLRLDVQFIFPLPTSPDNIPARHVHITGGVRRPVVAVNQVQTSGSVLRVFIAQRGDFSEYTLRIADDDGQTLAGLDPLLSEIRFGFRRQCDDGFDCQEEELPPAPNLDQAAIDYRARDYQGFRRLMLDRMAQLMPEWREPLAASQDVTLVEMLAHVADRLAYAQDRVATEAYLDTATLRRSAKRHARLVDYRMHDGANARTFVHVGLRVPSNPSAATSAMIYPGARFVTGIAGLAAAGQRTARVEAALGDEAVGAAVFEAMEETECNSRHNRIVIHDFGGAITELKEGATELALADPLGDLALTPGKLLLIEQVAEPDTGDAAPDFDRRHIVRLTRVETLTDPVGAENDDGDPIPLSLLRVHWSLADAMPSTWPLARVTTNDTIDDIPPGPDQPSVVVRGNIVPVDHGESSGLDEAFPIVKPGRRRAIVPLSRANVTQALAHDVSAPAATVLQSEPDKTAPVIAVTQDSGDASADGWSVVLDLLDADDTSRALVLDVEADGSAQLRSGDGELGRVPDPSVAMAIRYRVGNGPEGNVGAEAIRHLLTDGYVGLDGSFKLTFAGSAPDVVRVRNVVEAVGGTHPQSISEARRLAPLQFQDPERAVTPEDYARFAAGHPDVEAAKGIVRWTGSWNAIVLLLDLVGGKLLDDEFEEEIRDFLEPYRLAGHALEFRDPILVPLELEMRVCVEEAMPTDLVEEHLRHLFSSRVLPDGSLGLFHPDLFSFGSEVHLSKLYAAVHATAGVRHAEITEMRRQGDAGPSLALETGLITFGEYEIPILENRRDFPDRGRLSLIMEGGI